MGSWRARCGESRTPGSEGGLGKRTAGNGGTAPRSDPYSEALAAILRPGNAGANTAADHIEVLDAALAQLPVRPRGLDPLNGVPMLARADSAGATHDFLNALRAKGIEFSVGFDVTEAVRLAILDVPKTAWVEAVDQDYELREGAQIAELTDLLDLSSWPVGTRAIVRREEPHPGASFTLFDPEGWRYQVFLTDSPDDDLPYLEARHRGHARASSSGPSPPCGPCPSPPDLTDASSQPATRVSTVSTTRSGADCRWPGATDQAA